MACICFGDEAPVGHGVPLDQALRAVLKGIRQRIGADVAHGQRLALFPENEIHAAGQVLDRAGGDVAAHANTLVHGR